MQKACTTARVCAPAEVQAKDMVHFIVHVTKGCCGDEDSFV